MIGLGVAVDYALFVVSRFREEMRHGNVRDALATTMATAGRAILFSGFSVAVGFAGMLLVPIGALTSLGLAGTMVVGLAVIYSVTFLPALLGILGARVDAIRLPVAWSGGSGEDGLWHRAATFVMARPWAVVSGVVSGVLSGPPPARGGPG